MSVNAGPVACKSLPAGPEAGGAAGFSALQGSSPSPHLVRMRLHWVCCDCTTLWQGSKVYCFCRKGDNGRLMLLCDGPCSEWYHWACVSVKKEDCLPTKWLCPMCKNQSTTSIPVELKNNLQELRTDIEHLKVRVSGLKNQDDWKTKYEEFSSHSQRLLEDTSEECERLRKLPEERSNDLQHAQMDVELLKVKISGLENQDDWKTKYEEFSAHYQRLLEEKSEECERLGKLLEERINDLQHAQVDVELLKVKMSGLENQDDWKTKYEEFSAHSQRLLEEKSEECERLQKLLGERINDLQRAQVVLQKESFKCPANSSHKKANKVKTLSVSQPQPSKKMTFEAEEEFWFKTK